MRAELAGGPSGLSYELGGRAELEGAAKENAGAVHFDGLASLPEERWDLLFDVNREVW